MTQYGILPFNSTGKGIAGGMAFAADPNSFPQLENPICSRLPPDQWPEACTNGSQPWEKIAKAYGAVHGGMPQAREANLTAHLKRVQGGFSGRVPADFEGVCNIDFEGWQTNVWENIYCDAKNSNATNWRLYTHGYQMYSKLLVLRDHPDWDDARSKLVAISPAGILARDQALAAITPMIDDLVRDMGSDKVRAALPILRELRLRLEHDS